MHRRDFFRLAGAASALPFVPSLRRSFGEPLAPTFALARAPLVFPASVRPVNLSLDARVRTVDIAPGVPAEVWSPGNGPIGPTIDTRTGETARITLTNALPEPTILHWHGLRVPEAADGHPALVIPTGSTYRYEFPVIDRAGTYWYHAHPHHRTGMQAYRGMVGLLLIRDDAEERLGLPSGAREIPLLIQDRRVDAEGRFAYEPVMHERMEGFFGDTPFANGIRLPEHDVETTTYRLRVVNATTSRILRLALSTGRPMTLIGGDGGLLPEATTVTSVDLGTGERADLLVDFSKDPVGSRVALMSQAFEAPYRMGGMGGGGMGGGGMGGGGMGGGGMGGMGGRGLPQGAEMRLVEFAVTRAVTPAPWRPVALPAIARLDRSRATTTRLFQFNSARMQHNINGREFDMSRIDETVKFGDTEVWTFVNDSQFPHPVHMHEVQFQVLERLGGRARLMPWEAGWKDTVLVYPGERVSVIAAFDKYRGRFLMHCHNMVHEDMGMMMNYEIR